MLEKYNLVTGLLPVYFLSLLVIMIVVYVISAKNKRKQQELEIAKELNKRYTVNHITDEPKIKTISKPKHDEVIDTLNFMLQNQIISNDEYNRLLVRCLPYINK